VSLIACGGTAIHGMTLTNDGRIGFPITKPSSQQRQMI